MHWHLTRSQVTKACTETLNSSLKVGFALWCYWLCTTTNKPQRRALVRSLVRCKSLNFYKYFLSWNTTFFLKIMFLESNRDLNEVHSKTHCTNVKSLLESLFAAINVAMLLHLLYAVRLNLCKHCIAKRHWSMCLKNICRKQNGTFTSNLKI